MQGATRYQNLLEPQSLVSAFLQHPPLGFEAVQAISNVPAFATRFNILTTIDPRVRRRVMASPLYPLCRGLMSPLACLVGTTVTEYVPLPRCVAPLDLLRAIKTAYSQKYSLVIVKDIPQPSPLLDAPDIEYAAELLAACADERFTVLDGQALAYLPLRFNSIEQYLSQRSRARRKDLRRKLRSGRSVKTTMLSTGDPHFLDDRFLAELYALYANVYAQSDLHFDQLSPEFFRCILRDASSAGRVFVYRRNGLLIGFNLCYVYNRMLIDKYVGFLYPQSRDVNLYFVSWFENLHYALEQHLTHYVVGWTDPRIKRDLGAEFTFTRHAVYLRNPLLRIALRRLCHTFSSDRLWHDQVAV